METLVKRRENNLRFILYVMLLAYGLYFFVHSEAGLIYLFLKQIQPEFTGSDSAKYGLAGEIISKTIHAHAR